MLLFPLLQGGLLQPDCVSLHHPGLLHRAHRQPAAEEDRGREGQTAEGHVGGDVRGGGLLHLLPALRHRQGGAPERAAAEMGGGGEGGGSGLRRPDGSVVHGLSAGPAGLLLLPLGLQRRVHFRLLPQFPPGETPQGGLWPGNNHQHHHQH